MGDGRIQRSGSLRHLPRGCYGESQRGSRAGREDLPTSFRSCVGRSQASSQPRTDKVLRKLSRDLSIFQNTIIRSDTSMIGLVFVFHLLNVDYAYYAICCMRIYGLM